MLVLSRKRSQRIVIQVGEELVFLTVVEIRGDKCRLGLEAAKNVVIHRQEVYDAIQANQRAASA